VTAIIVGYSFNGCSGVNSFSNLNLDIGTPPNPRVPPPGPGFEYLSGPPEDPNFTQVGGFFMSNTAANGVVAFAGYPGCGNAIAGGIWIATKR
jgi:hypothetical protein